MAVDKFGKAFDEAGATKGAENVHINLTPDEDDVKTLDKFVDDLLSKVK